MQLNSTFKEMPCKKQLEWTIWTGPHAVPLGWNGDFSLKPFGPNFTVYFERLPYANCQRETWEGFDKTLKEFKTFLRERLRCIRYMTAGVFSSTFHTRRIEEWTI